MLAKVEGKRRREQGKQDGWTQLQLLWVYHLEVLKDQAEELSLQRKSNCDY